MAQPFIFCSGTVEQVEQVGTTRNRLEQKHGSVKHKFIDY